MENENINPNFDTPNSPNTPPPPQNPVPPTNTPPPNLSEIEKIKASILNDNTPPAASNPPINPAPNSSNTILNFLKNPKIIIGILTTIILITSGFFGYQYLFLNKGYLTIDFSNPPDKITINGQDYSPNSSPLSLQLKPGQYTIIANKSNHFPFSVTINLVAKQTIPVTIDLVSYPQTKEIVEYDTAFPHLNPNQNEITYLSAHGIAFYKLKINDFTKTIISENIFNHIADIRWAPSIRNACLITSTNSPEIKDNQKKGNILYDPSRPLNSTVFHLYDFSKYDFTSQNHQIYSTMVQHPTWHPTKEEILFHYTNPDTKENSISKAKPTLENRELVIELQDQNSVLAQYSPDLEIIAYVDTQPDPGEQNNIYIYRTVPRKHDKIPTKETYLDFIWSPNSQKILGFKDDGSISLIDVNTFEISDLPFKIPKNKLCWLNNSSQIIASISANQDNDKLILFDTSTNEPRDIVFQDTNQFQTIGDLFVTADDSTLYFVANDTQHLFSLPLILNQ